MLPEVGRSSAAIRCSVVDLPPPDGPTSTTNSPDETLSDAWSSTTPRPPPYDLTTSTSSRAGSLMLQRRERCEQGSSHGGVEGTEDRHPEREEQRSTEDPCVIGRLEHADERVYVG